MKYAILLVGLLLVTGCSNTTETGYEPRKLADSETVQRGYYAAPFSNEQRAAQQERASEAATRRPADWRPGM